MYNYCSCKIEIKIMHKTIKEIYGHTAINVIPGINGQRPFPTRFYRATDPFLMLDHIGPQKVGKDYFLDGSNHAHPHRGFETITFMFEGRMEHVDSLGTKASLHSGGIQRMNAGAGIMHGGDMASDVETERFHEVQLWINNPQSEKFSKPDVHNVAADSIPFVEVEHVRLRVISGRLNGMEGAVKTKAATQIGHLISDGVSNIEIGAIEAGYHLMVYVLEGQASVAGSLLNAHQLATFSEQGEQLLIETTAAAQLLILAGKPLREPVVFGGPFVMNTAEEIEQAKRDYQNGLFGTIK